MFELLLLIKLLLAFPAVALPAVPASDPPPPIDWCYASQSSGADPGIQIRNALIACNNVVADFSGFLGNCTGWTVARGKRLIYGPFGCTMTSGWTANEGSYTQGVGYDTVFSAANNLNAPVVSLVSSLGCSGWWHWAYSGQYRIIGNSANNSALTDDVLLCQSGENARIERIFADDHKGAGFHFKGIMATSGGGNDLSTWGSPNPANSGPGFFFDGTTGEYTIEHISDNGRPFIKVYPVPGGFKLTVRDAKSDADTNTAWFHQDANGTNGITVTVYDSYIGAGTAPMTNCFESLGANAYIYITNSSASNCTNLKSDEGPPPIVPLSSTCFATHPLCSWTNNP